MVQYPAVNDNADFELFSTSQFKVRNSSYEFAVLSKNKILRDFWETQSLKNGLNRQFWKKIARLWLRHLRFESLLRVFNAIKPVTSFCQVFKVEICKANTTVTWQVDIICHKKSWKFSSFSLFSPIFACVYDIDIFRFLWYIKYVNYQEISEHTFLIITPTTVDSNSCIEWCLLFIVRINYPKGLKKAPRWAVILMLYYVVCFHFVLRRKEQTMANKKKGVSSKTHTQKQLDDYANQHNPNNKAYKANQANIAKSKKHNKDYIDNVADLEWFCYGWCDD